MAIMTVRMLTVTSKVAVELTWRHITGDTVEKNHSNANFVKKPTYLKAIVLGIFVSMMIASN